MAGAPPGARAGAVCGRAAWALELWAVLRGALEALLAALALLCALAVLVALLAGADAGAGGARFCGRAMSGVSASNPAIETAANAAAPLEH